MKQTNVRAALLVPLLVAVLAACGGDNSQPSSPPRATPSSEQPSDAPLASDRPGDVLLTNANEAKVMSVPNGSRIKLALDLADLNPEPVSVDAAGRSVLEIEQQLHRDSGDHWTAYVRTKEAGTAVLTVRVSLDCNATSCRGAGMVRAPFMFRIQVTPV